MSIFDQLDKLNRYESISFPVHKVILTDPDFKQSCEQDKKLHYQVQIGIKSGVLFIAPDRKGYFLLSIDRDVVIVKGYLVIVMCVKLKLDKPRKHLFGLLQTDELYLNVPEDVGIYEFSDKDLSMWRRG